MTVPAARLVVMPRYVERFACTASACGSTCCAGWRIDVDRASYDRLRDAMNRSEESRAAIEPRVAPAPEPSPEPHRHALVVLREDGACTFLAGDNLCSLQQRLGEGALPDVCSSYPREVRVVRDRAEITATPSCPEVARQLLLHGDANDLVPAPVERLPRAAPRAAIDAGAPPWLASVHRVRAAMSAILGERRVSLLARLAALGCAAQETRPWFHRGALPEAPGQLERVFARYGAISTLQALERELGDIGDRADLSAGVVMSFLGDIPKSPQSALRPLLIGIAAAYAERDGVTRIDAIYQAYQARRRRWTERHAAEIDGYFTNWALHYVAKEWYVVEHDLVDFAIRLFVRVAVLRFLLLSHPGLDEADGLPDAADRVRALDAAVVDVVQRYSRDVEHDRSAIGTLDARVRARSPSIAHAMFMLNV